LVHLHIHLGLIHLLLSGPVHAGPEGEQEVLPVVAGTGGGELETVHHQLTISAEGEELVGGGELSADSQVRIVAG